MKMAHGWKMQVLKRRDIMYILKLFTFMYLLIVLVDVANAKTLKVDEVTPSVTDGDFTITPNGTGDIVIGSGSGFVKLTSGVLSNQAFIDLASEISGVLPIANGGTNSSTALSNNYVMISSGGAIVESAVTTTTLGYLDATSSIQTQLNAKVDEVVSTDNAIVKFDGTTGSIQNTTLIMDDSNNISGLSTLTFDQVATPSNPSAGNNKLYFKSDDNLYKLDSSGTETEIGAGGVGGINYITNYDIETDTTGYATYDDAAATPVDGTGGTVDYVTITRNTTTPLRKTGDLKISKSANNAQGEGVSYDFTIDVGQKARMLTGYFWYDATSANYTDDEIKMFVYDVTNSQLIYVNGDSLKAGSGDHYFQFQTASDSTSYRVIFHVAGTVATAYDVYLDQITIEPTKLAYGTLVLEQNLEASVAVASLTTTSGDIRWGSGNVNSEGDALLSYDDSNGRFTANQECTIYATFTGYQTSANQGLGIFVNGTDRSSHQTSTANFSQTASISYKLAQGEYITFNTTSALLGVPKFSISATRLVKNQIQSQDLGGKEIVLEAKNNSADSGVASGDTIDFDFTVRNVGGGTFTGAVYTVPESGEYAVDLLVGMDSYSANATSYVYAVVGGTHVDRSNYVYHNTSGSFSTNTYQINFKRYLVKGTTIYFKVSNSSGTSSILSGYEYTRLSIAKLASPQTQLQTEVVAASCETNAGQSIGTSTITVIAFEDLIYDTHGAYNTSTGVYTIPASGKYAISSMIESTASLSTTQVLQVILKVDGTIEAFGSTPGNGSSVQRGAILHTELDLIKGQQITISGYADASASLGTNGSANKFSIHRIK